MFSLCQYWALIRHMGLGWVLYRVAYAARRRSGLLRHATPAVAWERVPAPRLLLKPRAPLPLGKWDGGVEEADAALRGEFRLFSGRLVAAGFPPDWHRNQLTGEQVEVGQHWTALGDFAFGDIKGVWELSRFAWAFSLGRAYTRTKDARYADGFWTLFQDWCRKNPPNLGPNWMCGQEASFRLMGVVFAAEAMGVPADQQSALARFVVATARRIAANLNYAVSQENNHGVSECIGLITAGLLVPDFREGNRWLERGMKMLRVQLDGLVYEDGGFAQHSMIYHRVLLHDLCWCCVRLRAAGRSCPGWLENAARRALRFLVSFTDPSTGCAPLYGANDGSNVLPLAQGEFLDMRPVVQMASAVFLDELPLSEGPWDEAAAWLADDQEKLRRVPWPALQARTHAPVEGCFQLISGADRLFLRCPTAFRHRPGQADQLHVDIRSNGRAIAFDGGSFSYNSKERFTALGAAAHHNTVLVGGREFMQKLGRFLYLPWTSGTAEEVGAGVFRASHNGYAPLGVELTRAVGPMPGGGFVVRDCVTGARGHALAWHWRLVDLPWQISPEANSVSVRDKNWDYVIRWRSSVRNCAARLSRAEANTAYGWWSPAYGSVEPACALRLELSADDVVEFTTEFHLSRC